MSLVNNIVAVVETIGADIKALYTGKAEKEHTHTAAQVSGLGTAATKNVAQATGTSTEDVMTQKAVTDAINARGFADASGILTATSGALSNDMSSYLSSKTYADMRAKLSVVPVNVVQATGTSTEDVMSQKAVTDNLDNLGVGLDLLRQELNKLKERLPAAIGDERWGGFYIGDITIPSGDDAGTYMVIMAGEEGDAKKSWKTRGSLTTGTTDDNNGMLNTLAMVNAGISEHPAGEHCVNYRGGGYDDWYLPAINEVALAWDNRALLDDLKMGRYIRWASTQTETAQRAKAFNFNTGVETTASKTGQLQVRPVRRIKLEP